MHKIFRIFIILFLALSATIVVGQSCYNQPTYASMGSTGGGSTSTGGGSSSGGGGWSSSDSDSDADFFDLQLGCIVLPKSDNVAEMKENLNINFQISDEDMKN